MSAHICLLLIILSYINSLAGVTLNENSKIPVATQQNSIKPEKKDLIFLDGIRAVFRGSEGTDLILSSELQRPKLDGSPATLQEMLIDLALAQEAKKYRLWPSPEDVDKQLRMLSEANKKTPKEFDDLLLTIGYTPSEGRLAFAQINAVNALVGFKITGNLIVPESEVTNYYNENPEVEKASYYLQYTLVPFAQTQNKQAQLKQLQNIAFKNDPNHFLKWGDPFWIKEDELADDKQFITELKRGQISDPMEVADGFELFRLKEKKDERVKPLDERYAEIVNILRKPKYSELMANFQNELLDNASIIYFDLPQ